MQWNSTRMKLFLAGQMPFQNFTTNADIKKTVPWKFHDKNCYEISLIFHRKWYLTCKHFASWRLSPGKLGRPIAPGRGCWTSQSEMRRSSSCRLPARCSRRFACWPATAFSASCVVYTRRPAKVDYTVRQKKRNRFCKSSNTELVQDWISVHWSQ